MSDLEVTDKINQDTIQITKDLIISGLMVNAGLSTVIIIILLFITLGPGGAKSQLSNANSFFTSTCIPTTDGSTGFKQIGDGKIESCDPSGNNEVPSILSGLLDGTSKYDLSGNWINIGHILIFVGVITNILFIFSPYLVFIPRTIWFWFIKKQIEKEVNSKIANDKSILEKWKDGDISFKEQDEDQQIKKIEAYKNELVKEQFAERLGRIVEERQPEPISETGADVSIGGESKYKQKGGGSNKIFKFITNFAGFVGGEKCDSGETTRFFIAITHIIIFLVFGALLNGDPLSISSGLFGLFISFLLIFSLLGSLRPNESLKIFYAIFGIIMFFIWLIVGFTEDKKSRDNPLTISNIIKISSGILSLGLLCYFSGNEEDLTNTPSNKCYSVEFPNTVKTAIGKVANAAGNAASAASDAVRRKIQQGGGSTESIACLAYNFFNTINSSLAFGINKLIIIIVGLIFTPNSGKSLKDSVENLYGSRMNIFVLLVLLFVMIWDFIPMFRWLTEAGEAKQDKEDLFKKASELAFLARCNFNPEASPGEDDKGCLVKDGEVEISTTL